MPTKKQIEEIRHLFTRKGHSNMFTRPIINQFLDLVEKEHELLGLYQAYYNEPYDLEYHFEISKLEKDLGEMK
jgi:hypothetical protein